MDSQMSTTIISCLINSSCSRGGKVQVETTIGMVLSPRVWFYRKVYFVLTTIHSNLGQPTGEPHPLPVTTHFLLSQLWHWHAPTGLSSQSRQILQVG